MFSSDIGSIITTSLLRNVSVVQSENSNNVKSNNVSFESILNNLGSYSSSNHCCSCNSGTSSLDVLSMVTAIMGNSDYSDTLINSVSSLVGNTTDLIGGVSSTSVSTETVSNSKMDNAIKLLKEQVGKPYVWGANGPDSFDCSGLTRYIYKEALGIDIPRVSYDQAKFGKEVAKEDLQVGDLVFFDTMNKGRVSHVGIYIGDNEFIHASNKSDGVKQSKLEGYYEKTYRGARRPS